VIMFDTYERLGQLDEWVRTWLVPRLPATALTVLASRAAPDSAGGQIRLGESFCGWCHCAI